MKKNKLRNAMKRFRQGRITFKKLNQIKLACDLEASKQNAEVTPENIDKQ